MVAILERVEPTPSRRDPRFGERRQSPQFTASLDAGPPDRFAAPQGVDTLIPTVASNAAQEPQPRSKPSTPLSNTQLARQLQLAALREATNRVLVELAQIAFADIGDVFDKHGAVIPFADLPPGIRSAIAEYRVRHHRNGSSSILVRLHPKVPALAALARHLGICGRCFEHEPSRVSRAADRPTEPRSTQPVTGIEL